MASQVIRIAEASSLQCRGYSMGFLGIGSCKPVDLEGLDALPNYDPLGVSCGPWCIWYYFSTFYLKGGWFLGIWMMILRLCQYIPQSLQEFGGEAMNLGSAPAIHPTKMVGKIWP